MVGVYGLRYTPGFDGFMRVARGVLRTGSGVHSKTKLGRTVCGYLTGSRLERLMILVSTGCFGHLVLL